MKKTQPIAPKPGTPRPRSTPARGKFIDWDVLKLVLKKHALIFSLLFGMGSLFLGLGLLIFFLQKELLAAILSGLPFAAGGLGLMIFGVVSNVSSVGYYYDQKMASKYGVSVDGEITAKQAEDSLDTERDTRGHIVGQQTDRELSVDFRYRFSDRDYESRFLTDDVDLFARIKVGDRLPLRVLPFKPSAATPRMRALKLSLSTRPSAEWTAPPEVDPSRPLEISRSLLDEDDS